MVCTPNPGLAHQKGSAHPKVHTKVVCVPQKQLLHPQTTPFPLPCPSKPHFHFLLFHPTSFYLPKQGLYLPNQACTPKSIAPKTWHTCESQSFHPKPGLSSLLHLPKPRFHPLFCLQIYFCPQNQGLHPPGPPLTVTSHCCPLSIATVTPCAITVTRCTCVSSCSKATVIDSSSSSGSPLSNCSSRRVQDPPKFPRCPSKVL